MIVLKVFEALSTLAKAFSNGFFLIAPISTKSSNSEPVSLPYPITCSNTSEALTPAFCIFPHRVELLFEGLFIILLPEPPPNILFHQELLFPELPEFPLFVPLFDGKIPFPPGIGALFPSLPNRFCFCLLLPGFVPPLLFSGFVPLFPPVLSS